MLNDSIMVELKSKPIHTIRLILGDQLNAQHSWYQTKDSGVLYVVAEVLEEASYVKHHVQKVCAFFSAMERFSDALNKAGHRVLHLTLDDTHGFADMPALTQALCRVGEAKYFEYQEPDEYRLQQAFAQMELPCSKCCVSAEHFYLQATEFGDYIKPAKHNRLENFYRKLRQRFNILMEGHEPEGGAWNFDADNRASFKKTDLAEIPQPLVFANDVQPVLERLTRHNISTIGVAQSSILWPVTRQQSLKLLRYFCENCLPNFGRFQDAMTGNSEHAWSLYHSRLSFSINAKMLSPQQVIDYALKAYRESSGAISIAQIEGFIRQILGWREYVRAVYWQNAEQYAKQNTLSADKSLPGYFWDGNTKMRCMASAVNQSLEKAYAHHIQRLMITGNFCLLAGIEPSEVDEWYLGIYIDAIEWVEQPNTRGMSQWADGGWVATKPYCSGGNYINKMSDYCKDCHYDVKQKTSDKACPFNSLYWHFLDRHSDRFSKNPRMAMIYRNWQKQDPAQQKSVIERAEYCLNHIDSL